MRTIQPRGMRILLSGLSLGLLLGATTASHAQTTTFGSGFQLNTNGTGGPTLSGGSLTLTDGGGGEARSAFSNATVAVNAFNASFTYTSGGGADGAAFVLQETGSTALGASGGGLGYNGITPSAAIEFNLYNAVSQTNYATNGSTGTYVSTGNAVINTSHPINVSLQYDGSVLTESLKDTTTNRTYATTYTTNLNTVLGASTAYIGFTGGTGGVTSTQTISNFSFTNTSTFAAANPLALTGYNFAGIVNGTPNAGANIATDRGNTTSTGVNSGGLDQQYVFYARGYDSSAPNTGLPVGTTFTSAATNAFTNTTVKFAIANASTTAATPNVLLDYAGSNSNTLTLATPGKFTGLSFLNTGFNGNQTVTYVLNYSDGTTGTGSFTAPDNFNANASTAIAANGRIQNSSNAFSDVNSGNPELYEADITGVNGGKILNSITFTDTGLTGNQSFGIFSVSAISSAATPEPGSVALLASALLPIGGLALRRRRKV